MSLTQMIVNGDIRGSINLVKKQYTHTVDARTGMTPLMYSCRRHSFSELSKLLIELDPDIDVCDYKNRTILDHTNIKSFEIIEILLRKNIKYTTTDRKKINVINQIYEKIERDQFDLKQRLYLMMIN